MARKRLISTKKMVKMETSVKEIKKKTGEKCGLGVWFISLRELCVNSLKRRRSKGKKVGCVLLGVSKVENG